MAAVSTDAPTPPDPPATPMMYAVVMGPRSLRSRCTPHENHQPVDGGTSCPGVVERRFTPRIGTAPDGGHRGPSTLQTPGGGVGAPAHSTPKGNAHTQMMSLLGGRLQTAQVIVLTRRWHPASGVPSDRETCGLPSVNQLVAVGQARHDRSISGLPARGCPVHLAGPSDSRPSTCSLSTPIEEQRKDLTFGPTRSCAQRRSRPVIGPGDRLS